MTDWFILRVQGRKVSSVVEALGAENCWRPEVRRWVKPRGKHKPVEVGVPLIPGWLFVRSGLYGQFDGVSGVWGALKYGRLGPIFITDSDLDGLRSACEAPQGALDGGGEAIPVGTPVKLFGPLAGLSGIVRRYARDGYAGVELEGREVLVHPRWLSAIDL